MRFEPLHEHHLPDATALALDGYRREVHHVPALADDDARHRLGDAIATLVQKGHGTAAIDGDRLTGYLAFFGPIEGFFGAGTGCYSPLHGIATAGTDRERLTSLLFQHAAAGMIPKGVDTFAITTWHHDDDISRSLMLNGFGMRCTDAIRMVDPPLQIEPVPVIVFRVLSWSEAGVLLPLLNGLVRHLRQSPTFAAAGEFTSKAFEALRERRKSRYFVAFSSEEPIGYLEVMEDGENVLTTAPDMQNICGAYINPEYRGRGIYQDLLQLVLTTLRGEGVKRVGVDFETMNPTALRFWTKYFDRYTSSFARRIDDLG